MSLQKKLNFFSEFHFNSEEISKLTNEFGKFLSEKTQKELEFSKFSLMVDNATITGTNVCGMKVRYLRSSEEKLPFGYNGQPIPITKSYYQNKVIGVKYLQESSTAPVLFQAVNEKVFNQSEGIKKNLIDYIHDRGSNLSGSEEG